ncbi:MAG TPA: type II toxin-antitoxin system HicA family toxin [Patescibacteria group bacterium]|nr:type II toxin-antitoxin system HicA family toxin [Patescibacteria group bacterium]
MSKLPLLKSREVLSILFFHGFEKVRTAGSHIRLKKGKHLVTVSFHPSKTVPKGTLKSIIKQSGLQEKDFGK